MSQVAWDTLRMDIPDVHYARSGGVAIAYQIAGNGDSDLVYVPDWMSNLVYGWEVQRWRAFYERLARSFRLILFDKRGTGLSDHGPQYAALETRMEDLRAVLNAADSTATVVFGAHEGCGMAALFAATYPERTRALVLFHPDVLGQGTADRETQEELNRLREQWGTQEFADELLALGSPSLAASEEDRRWFVNWLRLGASPAVAYALNRAYFETDLRDVLPAVRVPTLVLYRPVWDGALDVAARIPYARAVRVSGNDPHGIFLSLDIADEIERFLAGEEAPFVPESVLTTVLFTDVVNSTQHAAQLGDRAWRDLLTRHHADVRRELTRYRGEEVDTAGDGFFCRFDGPARAIACARAVIDGAKELGLKVRSGIHTGECELVGDKITGIAVVTGSRISTLAAPGEVLVSSTVKDLVAGSGFSFDERGEHELKGVPGTCRLYTVTAS
jgi:class 3 adenylate cyclase/pimeloyl-ACP methyl ester carboxylesterase